MTPRHRILHFGIHKTGSKSLQKTISEAAQRNSSLLATTSSGGATWHKPLHEELLSGSNRELEALRRVWSNSSANYGFVSYEGFFELPDECAQRLVRVVEPTLSIIFIRDQASYLNSFMNQVIKAHRTTWDDILAQERAGRHLRPHLDFATMLRRWQSLLPDRTLRPIVYEPSEDSVRSLVKQTGLPLGPAELANSHSINHALDAFGLAVIREAKRRTTNPAALPGLVTIAHRLLANHFVDTRKTSHAPVVLDALAIERISELYSAPNEQLLSDFGLQLSLSDLSRFGFADLDAEAEKADCRSLVEEILERSRGDNVH